MNILIVTQYFWPENMRINDMVRDFASKGHKVTVLTGLPNYPEGVVYKEFASDPDRFSIYENASIVRIPMFPRGKNNLSLIINYLSFFVCASFFGAWRLRSRKFDAIFIYAVSPIMVAIPAIVIGKLKRAPTVLWVLDLWPETLKAVGVLKNDRLLSMVGLLVSWIYNNVDYILLQSKAFTNSVKKYCKNVEPDRIIYFPSWAEDNFSMAQHISASIIQRDESVFTIVFAGNIGEAQDFPAILNAAEKLRAALDVRWVIVGDGRMSEWLRREVDKRSLSNVLLLGRHPVEAMPPLFSIADALLVSLRTNEIFGKTIPGKVQAYLASGKPIIAMIDGEASRVIREAGAGLSCRSGDVDGLVEIVSKMASLTISDREKMGRLGKDYYFKNFSRGSLMSALEDIFKRAQVRHVDII